jgi:uncharacterized protein (TIGR02145 family)
MRTIFFVFFLFSILNVYAQNFYIAFTGTGATTIISSVKVENLSSGESITLNGEDVLHLSGNLGISLTENTNSSVLKIYPNPMSESSILRISAPVSGDALISIYEITGKPIAQIHSYLNKNELEFRLSGAGNGLFLISIIGNSYNISGKFLCDRTGNGDLKIEKINNPLEQGPERFAKKDDKVSVDTVDMKFTSGNRLKFTALAEDCGRIIVDKPMQNKTLNFNFISCTDGENYHYPVVDIGNQVWMSENLKTTYFNDSSTIFYNGKDANWNGLKTPGYCMYNHDFSNLLTYGALYNWYTVNSGKLCPIGWHIPSAEEWAALTNYLKGWTAAGGKLKETGYSHWMDPNLNSTDEFGFGSLPGGMRYEDGRFVEKGESGFWWSSSVVKEDTSQIWTRLMEYDNGFLDTRYSSRSVGLSARCLIGSAPTVSTSEINAITSNSATIGGNVSFDGNSVVTERGVFWGTTPNPELTGIKLQIDNGTGLFFKNISGLTENTIYYLKAYAINSTGINYGAELNFKTLMTVADTNGNVYNTVVIGTQTWMVENLKTTSLNDSTLILNISDGVEWLNLTTPGYCWNNSDTTNIETYGLLYNWYAVNTGKLCPAGWHIPNDEDWIILREFLGGESIAGGKLKESGITHWNEPNIDATNETGFTSLPGGAASEMMEFIDFLREGYWWSSTYHEPFINVVQMSFSWGLMNNNVWFNMNNGASVRCVKD